MAENFQNFYVTKLREACDAVATTIYVDTVPAITEGTLVIEYANSTKHEIIHFTGVSGYGLTGCTRGLEGTTAQSHSAGVDVRQNLTAGMIDKIINGVITTENIADSAVTTAKINDGAVTADKIDFTTLGGCTEDEVKFSGTKANVGNTNTTVKEYTITRTGLYFVKISAGNGSSTSKGRLSANCFKGDTEICSTGSWSVTAWSGNNFCECETSLVIWLVAGDVLTMKVRNQNVTVSVDWSLKVKNIF